MRGMPILVALGVFMAVPAAAQEWMEYRSVRDGFHALFPGEPSVTDTTWASQAGFMLPERVYTVERGAERYVVRVIDYRDVEQRGIERAKGCPPGAEPCLGSVNLAGVGYWKHDVRGAPTYALLQFVRRGGQVTDLFWNQLDLVSGIMAQMVNADGSRTYTYIAMHEMRLYLSEATVPAGYPEPLIFTQAVGWLDQEGRAIRYRNMYSHEIHGLREATVPEANAGAGGGRGGGGAQGGNQ